MNMIKCKGEIDNMTDKEKLNAIKENILARYKSNTESEKNASGGRFYAAKADEDREILSFMDSLPDEHADEDLEKASEEYAYINWQSDEYHDGASAGLPFDAIGHTQKCFKDGANWQKQQIMKEAVEAHIIMTHVTQESVVPTLSAVIFDERKYHEGDKVKVIII
jgi:hypothetical protein